jgi:hypothetical protein
VRNRDPNERVPAGIGDASPRFPPRGPNGGGRRSRGPAKTPAREHPPPDGGGGGRQRDPNGKALAAIPFGAVPQTTVIFTMWIRPQGQEEKRNAEATSGKLRDSVCGSPVAHDDRRSRGREDFGREDGNGCIRVEDLNGEDGILAVGHDHRVPLPAGR